MIAFTPLFTVSTLELAELETIAIQKTRYQTRVPKFENLNVKLLKSVSILKYKIASKISF